MPSLVCFQSHPDGGLTFTGRRTTTSVRNINEPRLSMNKIMNVAQVSIIGTVFIFDLLWLINTKMRKTIFFYLR